MHFIFAQKWSLDGPQMKTEGLHLLIWSPILIGTTILLLTPPLI
jgi:hypothetical protein